MNEIPLEFRRSKRQKKPKTYENPTPYKVANHEIQFHHMNDPVDIKGAMGSCSNGKKL